MLALRLPDDLEKRLDALARRTGRSKSFYAREAIEAHLADIEDAYLALDRLERGARRMSLDEVEAEFASVDAAARQDQ
jgi:RHH-type rel operon transcriptional repressor/antitoxin RelB